MNISIEKFNSVSNKIHCEPAIARELYEYFTFQVPGARFSPLVKQRKWDGKMHLFHLGTQLTYGGLNHYIEQFAEERNYTVDYLTDFSSNQFTLEQAKAFCDKLDLTLEPRDYQLEAFVHAVQNKRTLLLSPTASGKSFIIFLLLMYTLAQTKGRALIVVPTTSLVHQMISDFQSYTNISVNHALCQKIMEGHSNHVNKRIVVSTWQSIYRLPRKWFEQFDVVVGDEAHLFKAKSLTSIMSKMVNCDYRYGFTGTLDGTHAHRLVLEGVFGPVKKVTTTAELIEQKHLANFLINCIVLKYSDQERELMKKSPYKDEIDWIVRHPGRNKFITKLAASLEGNTLVLFQFVEKHGDVLYDLLKDTGKSISFVSGKVESTEREEVRRLAEINDNIIIVASYGTFSTGVNIKNLHNIIFASPSKSRIRNLQSIGRGLRKSETKIRATLYDIADDLTWKSWRNYTIQHMAERVKIYGEEKFEYKIHTVNLKG
jgi:superfamily II DNA or RNA helicase